ncbi:MAG: colanic acid/amylovoran biosynthesis glycosyltransferase [Cellvibrionaceae bacterium]|jgi:colanic acid/amylovoran biosynthesis glycosyltransferase
MKIAYLMNTYPVPSATFIRREIHALEKLGLTIKRYAVRKWPNRLVDPQDVAEQKLTEYLLSGNILGLLVAISKELISNAAGFYRGLKLCYRLNRNAKSMTIHHIAYFLQAAYLRQRTQAENINHIHVHFSTNATTVAMLAHVMGGCSYSFTVHGPDELDELRLSSIDTKIKHAAFVVAISHFCKSQLIRFSDYSYWDKIKIVRCGIDIDEFNPSKDSIAEDNQTLVCVGRLCQQKAQMLILKAIASLHEEFPNLKVIFVGDGDIRDEMERKINDFGISAQVVLNGWADNQKVRELIQTSRALILPSSAEGLPVVFMEALALETPVIATYIAGIPELVDEQCGWIIPAGSEPALENAIRDVLNASPAELLEKGKVGRERIENQHNINTIASGLYSEFDQAIKNGQQN